MDVWRKARIEGVRILEAMVEEGRTEGWSLGCMQSRFLGKGVGENGCEKSVDFQICDVDVRSLCEVEKEGWKGSWFRCR